uniref:Uncharacterized protein n=1 Tax=Ananas comosus var. bracteatus TaxID=296719 RepID=A0A6V7QLX1_ANACO|nr:unnamed protein product [Ananas comosus var. bracteatus]
MASSQTICRKYQVLMSNNMECVKNTCIKWDYKLPTSREAPNQAQNQVGLKFDPPQNSNRKLQASKARTGQFPPRGTGLSPAGTGLSLRTRKPSVRNRSLPARDRSLTARTRSEPVSTARDRLPRRLRSTVHRGTGLSYQGPVSESKTLRTQPKLSRSNF